MGFFSKDDKKKADPLELLKNLVPLNTLSIEDLTTLKDSSEFRDLGKGEYAFRQGDTDPHNIYLLDGELILQVDDKDVDSVAAGSATARFPIAHDIPRKMSAKARKGARVVVVDNHLLSKLLSVGGGTDYEVSDEVGGDDDWMTQLLRSEVFQRLPASSIQGVMMKMEEMEVAKGDKIILEGEVGDFYYLMHKGKADVVVGGKLVNRLGPGDRFGEDALLSGFPRNATISLLTDGVVVRLSREDFLRYVHKPLNSGMKLKDAQGRITEGAVWLDVRTPEEFAAGSMEGAINVPFDGFRSRIERLDDGKTYVCCESGDKRAAAAAFALIDRGYDAFYLEGGIPEERIGKPAAAAKADGASAARPETAEPKRSGGDTGTEVEALKRRLAEAETASKEYLDKLKKAKAAIDRSKAKRESEKQAMAVREQERQKMRETLMGLKESLAAKNTELERTRAHAEEAAQMRERLARMDKLLTGDDGRKGKQNRPSETELAFNEELSRQEERHGTLESELSDALNRLDDIESQRSKSEDLKKKLEAAQATQEKAIERVSELQKEEHASRKVLEASGVRIDKLSREIEESSAKGDAEARRRTEELRNQLEAARMERDRAKSGIDKIAKEREQRQGELDSSGDLIARLQKELDERERNERAQEEEYKRTLAALEGQLEEVKGSQAMAEQSARHMEEERKRMATELDAARRQLKEVEAKAGGQVEKLQRELEEARKQAEKERGGGAGSEKQQQAMRRMEALQKQLQKQQEELKRSESERAGLKEFLESRSGELHDLKRALTDAQVEAEEADFRRQEAEEARRQVEDALSRLHEQVENEKGRGTVTYDEEGNEYVAPRKSRTGLVVTLLLLAAVGGGGGYWFMTQGGGPKAPPVANTPSEQPDTPVGGEDGGVATTGAETGTEGDGDTPATDEPPIQEEAPATVDRSGEPKTGTPYREALADGGEAPALSYIRGGEFTMGNLGDPWLQEENPHHHVRVLSFYMGTYEVTFDEYDAFARATGRRLPDDNGFGRGDRPVINVNFDDAVAYSEWLSQQTGETYRLPSEAEWEYAARGGTKTDYWWGGSIGLNRANCFNCSSKWDGKATAPVGTFKPNPYGLFNTAGNVMEWTADCYNPSYRNAPGDGSAWLEGDCQLRVVRGSAYNRPAQSMRNSKRTGMDKDEYIPIIGIRVVREVGNQG